MVVPKQLLKVAAEPPPMPDNSPPPPTNVAPSTGHAAMAASARLRHRPRRRVRGRRHRGARGRRCTRPPLVQAVAQEKRPRAGRPKAE